MRSLLFPRTIRTLACLIVVGNCSVSLFAQQEEGQITPPEHQAPLYVQGELLVKFTEEATKAIEQARQAGTLPVVGIESLDALLSKYGVTAIDQVFANVPRETIEETSPERTKRAPPEAEVPELFRIYKLTFDPEQDIQQVASELLADPHVEFAAPNYVASIDQPSQGAPAQVPLRT